MCKIKNHPTLSYKVINNVTGWVAFLIASITYLLTIEPSSQPLGLRGVHHETSVGLQVGLPSRSAFIP